MAIFNVGAHSPYATIAAAMQAAGPGDTILLESGYRNETATVKHSGMTISGAATSTGIVLTLATGVATFFLGGTAPINVLDSSGANGITANGGNNVVTVRAGVDSVNGGLGTDRLVVDYHLATGAITGNSTSNFSEAGGGGRTVTITDGTFENFTVLTGAGADTLTVGDGSNIVSAGNGANTITAGNGTNKITGGNNADTITAGNGGNVIDARNGTNTVTSGAGNDVINSGVGAATIVAGGGVDAITIHGGAADVDSGAGADRLYVDYSALVSNVTGGVTGGSFGAGYTGHLGDSTGVNTADFVGTEAFTITGGSGNDSFTTGAGDDTLKGGAGNDILNGGGGEDRLDGGAGNDFLNGSLDGDYMVGGSGNDTYIVDNFGDFVVEGINSGTDLVKSSVSFSLAFNNVENLTLTGNAHIDGTGSSAANLMTGNAGSNTLMGGGGDDILIGAAGVDRLNGGTGTDVLNGGAGSDVLTGGSGNDAFLFNTALNGATNVDQIVDFNVANDTIHIDNSIMTALMQSGTLTVAAFHVGAAAHDANDRIIYNRLTGGLFYDSNGSAAGGSTQFAELKTGLALTNNDFLVV